MKKVVLSYASPKIQRLNSSVNGFDFRLITDTAELPVIGRQLANCVVSYADKMAAKHSLIVTVADQDGYQACIELHIATRDGAGLAEKLRIVQCRGRFNKALQGDILAACHQWSSQNQLEIACLDI